MVKPEMLRVDVPVLVKVTVCAGLVVPTSWLPKPRLGGERLTPGVAPNPVRGTVCGDPWASSIKISVAPRLPLTAGVNVTEIVQVAPFLATLVPQLFVSVKSLGLAPMIFTPPTASGRLPGLVRTTLWARLVVPTG